MLSWGREKYKRGSLFHLVAALCYIGKEELLVY